MDKQLNIEAAKHARREVIQVLSELDALTQRLQVALAFLNDAIPVELPVSNAARDEAVQFMRNGKKINAVKVIRDNTKCSLKDAVEYVNGLYSA